jgi:tRNA threonylcarbamoyl adenosine modification protein YeaZ
MQLAIETTGRLGSIALMDQMSVIQWAVLPSQNRTAMSLAPQIRRIIEVADIGFSDIDWVSVAIGPGSFTGLRVGVTTAKALSYAWRVPLVTVGSLAAIAAETFRCHANATQLVVAIEAYRGQAYVADFTRIDLASDRVGELASRASAIDRSDLGTMIAKQPGEGFTCGDQKLFADHSAVLARQCDAIGVGTLGCHLARQQQWSDAMTARPMYLKPSAAEDSLDS